MLSTISSVLSRSRELFAASIRTWNYSNVTGHSHSHCQRPTPNKQKYYDYKIRVEYQGSLDTEGRVREGNLNVTVLEIENFVVSMFASRQWRVVVESTFKD